MKRKRKMHKLKEKDIKFHFRMKETAQIITCQKLKLFLKKGKVKKS